MNRRYFMLGTLATVSLPNIAVAQSSFLNGELNRRLGTFDWTNGGGDQLQARWRANHFAAALAISRLNLSWDTQAGLRATLARTPLGRVDLRSFEGRVIGDVMVSGNGWLALRPRVLTSRWPVGRSTMANWWTWTNRSTGERWEVYVADVCGNLILTRLGQAVPCVCDGARDACV